MYHLPSLCLMWLFCSLLLSGPGSTPSKMKYMFVEGGEDEGVISYKAGGQQPDNQSVIPYQAGGQQLENQSVTQSMNEESMAVVSDIASVRGGQKANDITSGREGLKRRRDSECLEDLRGRKGLKRRCDSEHLEDIRETCLNSGSIVEGMKTLLHSIYRTDLKRMTAAEDPKESKEALKKSYDDLCDTWIHEANALAACGIPWTMDTDHQSELKKDLKDLQKKIETTEESLETLPHEMFCANWHLKKIQTQLATARSEGQDVASAREVIESLERQELETRTIMEEQQESWICLKEYLDDVTTGPPTSTQERKKQIASELSLKLQEMVDESPEQIEPAEDDYDEPTTARNYMMAIEEAMINVWRLFMETKVSKPEEIYNPDWQTVGNSMAFVRSLTPVYQAQFLSWQASVSKLWGPAQLSRRPTDQLTATRIHQDTMVAFFGRMKAHAYLRELEDSIRWLRQINADNDWCEAAKLEVWPAHREAWQDEIDNQKQERKEILKREYEFIKNWLEAKLMYEVDAGSIEEDERLTAKERNKQMFELEYRLSRPAPQSFEDYEYEQQKADDAEEKKRKDKEKNYKMPAILRESTKNDCLQKIREDLERRINTRNMYTVKDMTRHN
eukprot:GHVQ01029490.1.p1 GENE.GHVQ01029490.1~~GHVQ01029490.1.p1  ORF type:complete len:619 (+),score=85.44 GHVQ01029490.1:213-2069(+)